MRLLSLDESKLLKERLDSLVRFSLDRISGFLVTALTDAGRELQRRITEAKHGLALLESAVSVAFTQEYMKETNANVNNDEFYKQLCDHIAALEGLESEKAKKELWRAQFLAELEANRSAGGHADAMQEDSATTGHVLFDTSFSIVKMV